MTHLGEKVSALVDGQLPVDATERAHAHLANCRGCRDAVEAERLMKARLSCLPAAEPGADLMVRLLALGGPSGPLPPRPGHVPGSPRPVPAEFPARPRAGVVRTSASVDLLPRISRVGSALAVGPGRMPGLRPAAPAVPGQPPQAGRPAGRPAGRRRARLAGAVLGALSVVGAGVGGLVLAAPYAPSNPVPAQAPLDSFVVQRTFQPRVILPVDRRPVGLSPVRTLVSVTPSADAR